MALGPSETAGATLLALWPRRLMGPFDRPISSDWGDGLPSEQGSIFALKRSAKGLDTLAHLSNLAQNHRKPPFFGLIWRLNRLSVARARAKSLPIVPMGGIATEASLSLTAVGQADPDRWLAGP